MSADLALFVVAALLVALGVAGLLLPGLPGAPLVFAGLVVAAWAEGFAYVGFWWLALLAALAALTYAVDFAASALGAKKFGASPRAVVGAVLGGFAGLFFAPRGLLLGPFAGALAAEYSLHRDWETAQRAGFGATLGLVLGGAAKIALVSVMIGIFVAVRFFGGPE
ncbi:MAG: DUF456 domain-containing protein [Deltaproteobacteria bacterium]|nr:DUF456 domain-containing protein [Deltaproteobacteria bacterium]